MKVQLELRYKDMSIAVLAEVEFDAIADVSIIRHDGKLFTYVRGERASQAWFLEAGEVVDLNIIMGKKP